MSTDETAHKNLFFTQVFFVFLVSKTIGVRAIFRQGGEGGSKISQVDFYEEIEKKRGSYSSLT